MATHENHKHASDMWYGTQAICSADVLHRFAKALTDEGDKALARQYMAYAATLEQALQLLHDPDPKSALLWDSTGVGTKTIRVNEHVGKRHSMEVRTGAA
jgi:hypothetical protein